MAFRIKNTLVPLTTYHIGTYALPSEHAISVHVNIGTNQKIWIYSEDPKTLKDEKDIKEWQEVIEPTLEGELKKKLGLNRHNARTLRVLEKRTFKHG